jgi:hypothetical protein
VHRTRFGRVGLTDGAAGWLDAIVLHDGGAVDNNDSCGTWRECGR